MKNQISVDCRSLVNYRFVNLYKNFPCSSCTFFGLPATSFDIEAALRVFDLAGKPERAEMKKREKEFFNNGHY